MGPRGFRRGRRRGLVAGAAIGAAAARRGNNDDQSSAPPSQDNSMAELEKLGQLKEQGILTEEEFQAKKKQILGL